MLHLPERQLSHIGAVGSAATNAQVGITSEAGGLLGPGDVGEDRVVYFVDRLKDVIKTGGENVASIEIEKACFDVDPAIADVAVIGLPHERWVEAVTAIVVPKDGCEIDTDRLRARLRERLGGFKAPKAIVSVTEMPRTATGKIRKAVLRDRFVDLYGP
jgi:acyl-CoA synthetase (AMP-forming)/AMP-acid ligase II